LIPLPLSPLSTGNQGRVPERERRKKEQHHMNKNKLKVTVTTQSINLV